MGCKVNQYDGALLRRLLFKRGFRETKDPELVVVNTCAVTKKAIIKDRQLLARLRRRYPRSRFVVMGCWPQTEPEIAAAFKNKGIVFWGVGDAEGLLKKIESMFSLAESVKERRAPAKGEGLLAATNRSRYFLKVSDGCNQFCAYCLIPYARGRLKSRPSAAISKEAKAATEAGYREIVLCGIHLGLYGADGKGKEKNLSALIGTLLKIKNLGRLRLSSLEVTEVTPALIKLLARESRLCRHLHISLQSGSDKILKLMKRPYTAGVFARVVAALRQAVPNIALTTDVIVGFPGETAADFRASYAFAEKMAFSRIHVFPFSAHEQTAAFKLPGRVSAAALKERATRLRRLSARLEEDYRQKILAVCRRSGLKLVREQGAAGRERLKTEFGFDLWLDKKDLTKNALV